MQLVLNVWLAEGALEGPWAFNSSGHHFGWRRRGLRAVREVQQQWLPLRVVRSSRQQDRILAAHRARCTTQEPGAKREDGWLSLSSELELTKINHNLLFKPPAESCKPSIDFRVPK